MLSLSLAALMALATPDPAASRAIGFYSKGSLEGGVQLSEAPDHYLLFPTRCYALPALAPDDPTRGDNTWGHASTVAAISETLAAVRALHPDAPRIAVAELSNRVGGLIDNHLSHQNGLDVDIPFWQRGASAEEPLVPCTPYTQLPRFEVQDPSGWHVPAAFERAWNWSLAAAFAARKDVKAIFVGTLVKKALADWARANGVPVALRQRTLAKLVPVFCRAPRGVELPFYRNNFCPHDDHFHVRMKCPKDSPRCVSHR